MTRVANLTTDNPAFDELRSLEAERELAKVTVSLTPQMDFIIENLQHKLSMNNRTATVRALLEAASLDWLEANGYSQDSDEFREKYLGWLKGHQFGPEQHVDDDPVTGEPITGRYMDWNKVAL